MLFRSVVGIAILVYRSGIITGMFSKFITSDGIEATNQDTNMEYAITVPNSLLVKEEEEDGKRGPGSGKNGAGGLNTDGFPYCFTNNICNYNAKWYEITDTKSFEYGRSGITKDTNYPFFLNRSNGKQIVAGYIDYMFDIEKLENVGLPCSLEGTTLKCNEIECVKTFQARTVQEGKSSPLTGL